MLGYGTSEGGRMKATRSRFDATTDYIVDPATGEDARSVIDEDALRGIGERVDPPYLHRESGDGVAPIVSTVDLASLGTERRGRGRQRVRARQEATGRSSSASPPSRCGKRLTGLTALSQPVVARRSPVSTDPRPRPATPPPHDLDEHHGVGTLLDDARPGARPVRPAGPETRHTGWPSGEGTTARRKDRGPP